MATQTLRIGLISDTHGLMRPEALVALQGCDRIIHAGDIGTAQVLDALRQVAPVEVIRGNIDRGSCAATLPHYLDLDIAGIRIHVLHDAKALDIDPVARSMNVIVAGHSHKPGMQMRDGVLHINPGSAGPRRFKLPNSIGYLVIEQGRVSGSLQMLG